MRLSGERKRKIEREKKGKREGGDREKKRNKEIKNIWKKKDYESCYTYIVATCKNAECKSVRDLVSFVLQKAHRRAFESDETFKGKKYVSCSNCSRVSSVANASDKILRIISFYASSAVNSQDFMIFKWAKEIIVSGC